MPIFQGPMDSWGNVLVILGEDSWGIHLVGIQIMLEVDLTNHSDLIIITRIVSL